MALIFVEPDIVEGVNFVLVDGQCYSRLLGNTDQPPSTTMIDRSCDSCRACPCVPGACCGGATVPEAWQCTIRGFSGLYCGGACYGTFDVFAKVDSFDLNGSHCLEYNSDYSVEGVCAWSKILPISIGIYSDSNCSTLVGTVSEITLSWTNEVDGWVRGLGFTDVPASALPAASAYFGGIDPVPVVIYWETSASGGFTASACAAQITATIGGSLQPCTAGPGAVFGPGSIPFGAPGWGMGVVNTTTVTAILTPGACSE